MYHSVSYVSKSKSECKTFVSVLRLQSYYVFFYVPNALNTFNNKVTAFCFTYYIRGLKGFVTFVYVCLHYVLRASCARTSLTHARTLYTQKTFSRCPGYLLPLHYLSPTLHYLSPTLHYLSPTLHYLSPTLHYLSPTLHYLSPTLHYLSPTLHYLPPTLHYLSPTLHYLSPTLHYLSPTLHYLSPTLHYLSPTLHYLSPNAALPIPNAALPLHICGGRQNPPDAPHRLARRGVNISIQIFFLSFLRIYSELREKIIKTNGNPHLLQTAVYYQK